MDDLEGVPITMISHSASQTLLQGSMINITLEPERLLSMKYHAQAGATKDAEYPSSRIFFEFLGLSWKKEGGRDEGALEICYASFQFYRFKAVSNLAMRCSFVPQPPQAAFHWLDPVQRGDARADGHGVTVSFEVDEREREGAGFAEYLMERTLEISLWAKTSTSHSVIGTAFMPLFMLSRQGRQGVVSADSIAVMAPGETDPVNGKRVGQLHMRAVNLGHASDRQTPVVEHVSHQQGQYPGLTEAAASGHGQQEQGNGKDAESAPGALGVDGPGSRRVMSLVGSGRGRGWDGAGGKGAGLGLVRRQWVERFMYLRREGRLYGMSVWMDRENPPLDVGFHEPPGGWFASGDLKVCEEKLKKAASTLQRMVKRDGMGGKLSNKAALNESVAELSDLIKLLSGGEADGGKKAKSAAGQAERRARRGLKVNALVLVGVAELLQLPMRVERAKAKALQLEEAADDAESEEREQRGKREEAERDIARVTAERKAISDGVGRPDGDENDPPMGSCMVVGEVVGNAGKDRYQEARKDDMNALSDAYTSAVERFTRHSTAEREAHSTFEEKSSMAAQQYAEAASLPHRVWIRAGNRFRQALRASRKLGANPFAAHNLGVCLEAAFGDAGEAKEVMAGEAVRLQMEDMARKGDLYADKRRASRGGDEGEGEEEEGADVDADSEAPVGCGSQADSRRAYLLYSEAAEGGVISAMFLAGLRLAEGRGVARDDRIAAEWLRKASERGHAGASYALGVMLGLGRAAVQGVSAADSLRRATAGGSAMACHNLGVMIREGFPGAAASAADAEATTTSAGAMTKAMGSSRSQDGSPSFRGGDAKEQASRLLNVASDAGLGLSKYELGLCMIEGGLQPHVKVSSKQGMMMLEEAARSGHSQAAVRLALMLSEAGSSVRAAEWLSVASTLEEGRRGGDWLVEESVEGVRTSEAVEWAQKGSVAQTVGGKGGRGGKGMGMGRAAQLLFAHSGAVSGVISQALTSNSKGGGELTLKRLAELTGEGKMGEEAAGVWRCVGQKMLGIGFEEVLEQPQRAELARMFKTGGGGGGGLVLAGEEVVKMLYGEGAIAARVIAAARGLQAAVTEGFDEAGGAFVEYCREGNRGRVEATLLLRGYGEADCDEEWRERACHVISKMLEVGLIIYDAAPLDPDKLASARRACGRGEPHNLYIFADNSVDRVRRFGTRRSKPIVGGGPRSASGSMSVFEWGGGTVEEREGGRGGLFFDISHPLTVPDPDTEAGDLHMGVPMSRADRAASLPKESLWDRTVACGIRTNFVRPSVLPRDAVEYGEVVGIDLEWAVAHLRHGGDVVVPAWQSGMEIEQQSHVGESSGSIKHGIVTGLPGSHQRVIQAALDSMPNNALSDALSGRDRLGWLPEESWVRRSGRGGNGDNASMGTHKVSVRSLSRSTSPQGLALTIIVRAGVSTSLSALYQRLDRLVSSGELTKALRLHCPCTRAGGGAVEVGLARRDAISLVPGNGGAGGAQTWGLLDRGMLARMLQVTTPPPPLSNGKVYSHVSLPCVMTVMIK